MDESGGFTALGADILREMCDEYGRVPRLVMGLRSEGAVVGSEALLTDAVSFSSLSSLADLYVPMGGYTNGNGGEPQGYIIVKDLSSGIVLESCTAEDFSELVATYILW